MTGKRALYRRKPCTITPCSVLYLVGIYNFLEKCEVTRELKIWKYFEDYVYKAHADDDVMFFDDGKIAGMVLNEFDELLAKYGLWYELGFSWSLTAYRRR